jgi:hypothetical protein
MSAPTQSNPKTAKTEYRLCDTASGDSYLYAGPVLWVCHSKAPGSKILCATGTKTTINRSGRPLAPRETKTAAEAAKSLVNRRDDRSWLGQVIEASETSGPVMAKGQPSCLSVKEIPQGESDELSKRRGYSVYTASEAEKILRGQKIDKELA